MRAPGPLVDRAVASVLFDSEPLRRWEMKLIVVGLGQCGGRIADAFARLNKRARSQRGIEIICGTYAVNTDSADLAGLYTIKSDGQHRILIGVEQTRGHGVAKISELGAEIAKHNSDKVIDAIRTTKRLQDSDAFLLVAGTGGGTGSGAIPVMIQHIKERYVDKPVYAVLVLPFEHEERTEERTLYNTAVCLKSVYSVADAVFLIDNQRYVRKDTSLRNNMAKINELIVEPFYNLLCTGEEKKTKHIGTKVLDAGDIMQTLSGWTAMGYGKSLLPLIRLPFEKTRDFRKKGTETHRGVQAMDETLSELSIRCDPKDAGAALYLLCGPASEMSVDLVKELGEQLRSLTPEAVIRSGDYPVERGVLDLVVILSQLKDVERVRQYYTRASSIVSEIRKKQTATPSKSSLTEEASKDIPTLV